MTTIIPQRKILLLAGDILVVISASYLSGWLNYGRFVNTLNIYTGATVFSCFFYLACLYVFDLYNTERSFSSKEDILRIMMAIATAAFITSALFYGLRHWQFGRRLFLYQAIIVCVLIFSWRRLYTVFFPIVVSKQKALIIGAGKCGLATYQLLSAEESSYEIIGFLDDDPAKWGAEMGSPKVLDNTDRIIEIAQSLGAKTAILAITHNRSPKLLQSILQARLKGIKIVEMPTLVEHLSRRVPVRHIHEQWLAFEGEFRLVQNDFIVKFKRLIDLLASGVFLILFSPIMAAAALAIRLDSPGPVFFLQDRVGKDGVLFKLVKFRSMCQDAEKCGAVWATPNDPRVTRVGKWLRLFRIDELPQLWNVFRGEMSLIGPRPERPEFVKELEKEIPFYFIRHYVRPGISGWAQVNYRYGASVEDALRKLEYDLYYVKNMSLILELKIFLKTVGVVIFNDGAR